MVKLICGIDEAGRGCLIGSMIICGVVFDENNLKYLEEIGVKDSKKLSPNRRTKLCKLIIENCQKYKVIDVTVEEIDNREHKKITLNELELEKFAEILNFLKPDEAYLDAVDVNEERFKISCEKKLNYKGLEIVSKHNADDLFPIVSAASIVAKTIRDEKISELKHKYGDLGSGYSSDVKTIEFVRNWVKKNKKIPHFVRKSWDTTKKILETELYNKKISDFL
jgi:ribonuclease HII